MRLIRFLIALMFVAAGVIVGALNAQPVAIDLGFMVVPATLGVVLLATLLLGAILGGLMLSASVIVPLRQQLRDARSRRPAAEPAPNHPGRS